MIRSLVVVLIILPLLTSSLQADLLLPKAFPDTRLLMAQADQPRPVQPHYTMTEGYIDGKIAAEGRGTAGSFLGGFTCGILTGLVGTGILWGITRGDSPPYELKAKIRSKGTDYREGFIQGYKERTKQKKRGARLGGGLLGTAGILALIFSASDS